MTTATRTRPDTRRHKTIKATSNPNVFTAPSNSTPGVTYTQTIDERGIVRCDCPGYDQWAHCWHSDIAILVASRRPKPRREPDACPHCGGPTGLYGCAASCRF